MRYLVIIASAFVFTGSASAQQSLINMLNSLQNLPSGAKTAESFEQGQRAASDIALSQQRQMQMQQSIQMQAEEHAIKMETLKMQNELLRRQLQRQR